MPNSIFHSTTVKETIDWATRFALTLKPGDVIGLIGNLGAGKTLICQSLCQALGFKGNVTSPTYSIVREYSGQPGIVHIDFYRTKTADEFLEIGLDYYFNTQNICLVEWADKTHGYPIHFTCIVSIEAVGENQRKIETRYF